MTGTAPKFRELTERQSLALLRRHGFGRLAFTFKDHVDVEPIGYLVDGDWLYGRTSQGAKLAQLKRNPWVALEVDEVDGPFDWLSVVAHGTVYFLNTDGEEHPDFEKAVSLFRRFDRRTLQADDPAPHRTVFFRIHLDQMTGRSASTASSQRIKKGKTGER